MTGIEALACSNKDFGRPSGHLFGATIRLTLLLLEFFNEKDVKGRRDVQKDKLSLYERVRSNRVVFGVVVVNVVLLLLCLMVS